MTWLWKTLFFALSVTLAFDANSAYTFEDLQALEQQKAYREYLEHARDIRPSERTKLWSEMLSHMATDYMVHLKAKKEFDKKSFVYALSLTDWPELREDAFFHTKFEAYVLGYLKNCYERQMQGCREQAQMSWDKGRMNLDNGTLLAELLVQYDPSADITNYISQALKSDVAKFYCRKDAIQNWVISKTATKVLVTDDIEEVKRILAGTIHSSCLETLAPNLKRALISGSKEQRAYAYRVLKSQNLIDKSDEDLYLTTYLLEGPSVGKIFNLAWAVVKQIGQDYDRRQTLLKRLAKLDPLPDALFDSGNTLKRETLSKFLVQNIPEYFNFYADTCVSYRKGLGDYPNGNPTIQCDKFFTQAMQHNWLSQEVKVKYSATLKP